MNKCNELGICQSINCGECKFKIQTSFHSVNAIEKRATKDAQMGVNNNEYDPEHVAHYVYEKAYEKALKECC
jgi:hypothetical protein